MSKYLDTRAWKRLAREGKAPKNALLRKHYGGEVQFKGGDETDLYTFVLSTDNVDRMGDSISLDGWDTENFVRGGGPVLWAHDYSHPPVGRSPSVRVDRDALRGDVLFTPRGMSPFNDMIQDMVKGGFLNTVSVGFVPKEFDYIESDGVVTGFNFTKQELLEFSVVPVPANPDAVIEARSAGIDLGEMTRWVRSALDLVDPDHILVSRDHLLSINRALGWEPSVWLETPNSFCRRLEQSLWNEESEADPEPEPVADDPNSVTAKDIYEDLVKLHYEKTGEVLPSYSEINAIED